MKPSRLAIAVLSLCAACKQPAIQPVVGPAPVVVPEAVPAAVACKMDRQCDPGERCCDGKCVIAECCTSGDCFGRVCADKACQPCSSALDCGSGQVCCQGLCHAGDCCADAQCNAGKLCRDNRCGACSSDGDCEAGGRCCSGACVAGAGCCSNADCGKGVCEKNQCAACTADAQCGSGLVCCKGSCVVDGACELGVRVACSPACPAGRLCCNGACVLAQCCTDTDCAAYPSAPLCINGACQKCTSDTQCPANNKCCGGSCHPGTCCPGDACAHGQACLNYTCGECTLDADCGTGNRCCDQGSGTNVCTKGCCSDADCSPYVCRGGACAVCTLDSDCGKGARCCGGVCYTGAQCCARADCTGSQICSAGHKCIACVNPLQCGLGARCCNGSCASGTCCTNDDCNSATTGLVCIDGHCQLCQSDDDCGGRVNGHLCCAGKCVSGSCCADTDCKSGQKCVNNGCGACVTSGAGDIVGNCDRGQVCCPPTGKPSGAKSCQSGTCCQASDCAGQGASLVCASHYCSPCDDSVQATRCPTGTRCCGGACYTGDCCSNADCHCGAELCQNGKCVSCQQDTDCGNGSACCPSVDPDSPTKVCKPFCTSDTLYDLAADFDKGKYNGVAHSAAGQALDPDCAKPDYLCLPSGHGWKGTWTVVYDSAAGASTQQPYWKTLTIKAKIPSDTGLTWRARVADDPSKLTNDWVAWSDWIAIVPTSTDYAIYKADLSYVPGLNGPATRPLIQVQLALESASPAKTPVVDSVGLQWWPDDPHSDCTPCGSGYFRCGAACCPCESCTGLHHTCGSISDRCGHTLLCGSCPNVLNGSNICSAAGNACELVCNMGYTEVGTCCAATSCAVLGKECDDWDDGCGGTLHCGHGNCPNPANGAGFCSKTGQCDFTCNHCYVKSGSSCANYVETFSVSVTSSTWSLYVTPSGVGSTYHAGTPFSGQASATTKNPVTWSKSGGPSWLSLNPATGALSGTPTNNSSDPGTYTVTLTATTDCGNVGSTTITINVLRNEWCGDGVVNGNEQCDTNSTTCTSTYVAGLPSYCQGIPVTGVLSCDSSCHWGTCTAGTPTYSSNSFGECDNADIGLSGYACCAMDSCLDDACCGGTNGTNSSLPGGYTQEAYLPNQQSAWNGNCRLGRSGTNWDIAVSHTTASFRCWQ